MPIARAVAIFVTAISVVQRVKPQVERPKIAEPAHSTDDQNDYRHRFTHPQGRIPPG